MLKCSSSSSSPGKRLNGVIAEVLELPVERLAESPTFEELGLDSLDALRIVAAIEREFDIEIPEEEIPAARSIADMHELLRQRMEA